MHPPRGKGPNKIFLPLIIFSGVLIGFAIGYLFGSSSTQGGSISIPAGVSWLTNANTHLPSDHGYLPVCLNTCKTAGNGWCGEGRRDNSMASKEFNLVTCDLGTDCADCGPWTPSGPAPWTTNTSHQGPIAVLLAKKIQVRTKITMTPNPFLFAHTDPAKDIDVSRALDTASILERGITEVFYKIFKGRCFDPFTKKRELFVDVGANFGWYAILAAVMGCRVHAFEPVPHFRAFLEYNLHVNGLMPLVTIHSNLLSHETGMDKKMVVPERGIWGTAGIDGMNIDPQIESKKEVFYVPSRTLDEMVQEDVLLLKVDVEGWEWSVLAGATKLLSNYEVENVILEYSPGAVERAGSHDQQIATVKMLQDFHSQGFEIGNILYKEWGNGWGKSTPAFEEVSRQILKYDMEDAVRYKAGTLGCPFPEELKVFFEGECNTLPYDFNPRSFRSGIWFNTNVWASKNKTMLKLKENVVASAIHPSDPIGEYFITRKNGWGLTCMVCNKMPPKRRVRYRCHCSNKTICGEEESLVSKLASEGKLPNQYILP